MVGRVHRFRSRRELIEREAAAAFAAQVGLFPDDQLPAHAQHARAVLLSALKRLTSLDPERSIWPGGFVMLSQTQVAAVWTAIRALPPSARPHQVRHAFDLVLLNLQPDTGEVLLTRAEFAEKIGASADNVSTVMSTLVRLGVLRREVRPIAARTGPGAVVWFVNPHVAWNGRLALREEAAEAVPGPLLVLMDGGGGQPA
jgi:hypothetical protein